MADHLSTGALGEACAASFLSSQGFIIIERNFRAKFGELDIVANDADGTLVIVEVKALSFTHHLSPEDNLTRSKFLKLSRTASFYANLHPDLVDNSRGWRIDLVTISFDPSPDSIVHKYGKINFAVSHYKNIFY